MISFFFQDLELLSSKKVENPSRKHANMPLWLHLQTFYRSWYSCQSSDYLQGAQVMRLCGFWAYFRIFMRLFLLCGYAVIRIISFLDLPLFAKIPLILPNLSHFSLTIGFTFVISLAIQSIRSICESLFITLIIFLRILPTNAQLFCYITYIFLLFCVNYRFISGYNGINDCTENFNIFVDL